MSIFGNEKIKMCMKYVCHDFVLTEDQLFELLDFFDFEFPQSDLVEFAYVCLADEDYKLLKTLVARLLVKFTTVEGSSGTEGNLD